jgi:hypothetical protein
VSLQGIGVGENMGFVRVVHVRVGGAQWSVYVFQVVYVWVYVHVCV